VTRYRKKTGAGALSIQQGIDSEDPLSSTHFDCVSGISFFYDSSVNGRA